MYLLPICRAAQTHCVTTMPHEVEPVILYHSMAEFKLLLFTLQYVNNISAK